MDAEAQHVKRNSYYPVFAHRQRRSRPNIGEKGYDYDVYHFVNENIDPSRTYRKEQDPYLQNGYLSPQAEWAVAHPKSFAHRHGKVHHKRHGASAHKSHRHHRHHFAQQQV